MTDDTTNAADASNAAEAPLDQCDNERAERNHYFHGKLMTARDMAAEQRYHAGQRRAHARNVAGAGVAWGLDASVRRDDDSLTVIVEEGYAIDECGRPVVVPQDREKTVTDPDTVGASAVTVSLSYEACLKESVPVSGAESACEDECAYNRVLEVYDVAVSPGAPGEVPKGVPGVTFPTRDDLDTVSDREAPDPTDAGLATIARTYQDNAGHESADPETNTVFVGAFEDTGNREDDGTVAYERVAGLPTSHVYTNDMLYAATARHAADFGNPHQVTLETETPEDGGARMHILDDESEDPDVTLDSEDDTVAIAHQPGAQRVDFSVEEYVEGEIQALEEQLTERIDGLEERLAEMRREHARDSLAFKRQAFHHVEACFGSDTAAELTEKIEAAIEEEVYEDPETYVQRLQDLEDLEAALDLGGQARECDLETYEVALDRLSEVLERRAAGEDVPFMELVSAQNRVSEAAGWMDPKDAREEEEPTEPAGVSFTEAVHTEHRGDIVTMEVNLENTDTATLVVGEEDVNYRSTVGLTDGNGDGTVTVRMNTFLAGRFPGEESRAFGAVADADSASATLDLPDGGLDAPLEPAEYRLSLLVDGSEEAVGTLILDARSTDGLTVHRAPADDFGSLDSVETLKEARDGGSVTPVNDDVPVAVGDTIVEEIEVSGIFGAIAARSGGDGTDLDAAEGLVTLRREEILDIELDEVMSTEDIGVSKSLDLARSLEEGAVRLLADPDGDRLFVVVDSTEAIFRVSGDEVSGIAGDEGYEATFTISGFSPLVEGEDPPDETVSARFRIVEAAASFDVNEEGFVLVENAADQAISGGTTIAPETELTIRARSTGGSPFIKTQSTTVTRDRSFEGSFDFSGVEEGTSFTLTLQDVRVSDEASGRVLSSS